MPRIPHPESDRRKPPVVSILMLTFNRPAYISRGIQSILRQNFHDWELLVVQDGANAEIHALMADWVERDDRIRHLPRGVIGNIAEASNHGLRHARGRYVAILDDDDYWCCEDKLDMQVRFLDAHPEYIACGGGIINIDEHGAELSRILKPLHHDAICDRALLANPIAHSTAMYRRDDALAAGGYDETMAGFQDWDLWLKLGLRGRLANFPEYLLYYQIWPGSGSLLQSRQNVASARTIVRRYRRRYRHFPLAYTMAMLYSAYAQLPLPARRASYAFLSRMKKATFAANASPSPNREL